MRRETQTTLEATHGQMDGFFSHLPYTCSLEEVASVGDGLKICPQVDPRVVTGAKGSSSACIAHLGGYRGTSLIGN